MIKNKPMDYDEEHEGDIRSPRHQRGALQEGTKMKRPGLGKFTNGEQGAEF